LHQSWRRKRPKACRNPFALARGGCQLQAQNARQQVGTREAETVREVGIAEERSKQQIAVEAANTAEKDMQVQRVRDVQAAEIARNVAEVRAQEHKRVAVVAAEADKEARVHRAEGDLVAATKEAEGVSVMGTAKASAEQAMQMAPIEAQIKLAKEVGGNTGYQTYLIRLKEVEAGQVVGVEMAQAMKAADLKVIANSGDMQHGVASVGDMFTPAGGTRLTGMLAALGQTKEGAALLDKLGVSLVVGKAVQDVTVRRPYVPRVQLPHFARGSGGCQNLMQPHICNLMQLHIYALCGISPEAPQSRWGISGERTMSTMSLFDVSLIRAGVSDQAVTDQVKSLLKSRTFLDTLVFEHLSPTSRRTRVDTVLMLANGCECNPRTLGEHFGMALKWFDCAVTQALLQLEKVPARTHERGLN